MINKRHLFNRRRSTPSPDSHGSDRSGAAVVEFAMIAPLMILLTLGMMEVGRMVMVKQLLINASREGARMAVLPGATADQVISHVESELVAMAINGAQVKLDPSVIDSLPAGTNIEVRVSIDAMEVSWVPNPVFSIDQQLVASTTMRRESR